MDAICGSGEFASIEIAGFRAPQLLSFGGVGPDRNEDLIVASGGDRI